MAFTAKSLAVIAFSAAGAAVAGPSGALVGHFVGGLMGGVLPGLGVFTAEVATRLASSMIASGSTSLADRMRTGEVARVNHDLQIAFRDAFALAINEVGGPQAFPEEWKLNPREQPSGVGYFATSTGNILYRRQDPLAAQACDCLRDLRRALESGEILPLKPPERMPAARVEAYLQADTPADLSAAFFDQVLAPFLAKYTALTRELPDFEPHLRRVLLDRTLVHLGELLKTREPAWRAYNRLALEDLRGQLRGVSTGQEEILQRLDALLDQPDASALAGVSDELASLLQAAGEIEKRLDESLESVLARVADQHRETIARLDGLLAGQKRVEKKVDRVLRILEDGRYVIEGKTEVGIDRPPAPGEPPFKGLQFFDETDAELFFGREGLTSRLIRSLGEALEDPRPLDGQDGHAQFRFLAVIGASGSGKSSVVRAGLVPALRSGKRLADGSLPPGASGSGWRIHLLTPTARPLDALATAVVPPLPGDATIPRAGSPRAVLSAEMARSPQALTDWFAHAGTGDGYELIVVDQYEELFSLCRGADERQAFTANLLNAAAWSAEGAACPKLALVITLRADFYAHCAEFEALRQALEQRQVFIGPMTRDELCAAIEEPARANGWSFERGLVDLILRDVGVEPGALPLLSHALLETWKHRRGTVMTLESYAESGGVRGAIAKTAETVYHQRLTPLQQQIARNIFMRLTEPGESAAESNDTRRRAEISELVPLSRTAAEVETVLKTLADARLITTSEETAEVAHEALIREWPTLRGWLDENRSGLRLHRQLTEAAQEWERMRRDSGSLYRGLRLDQALEWARGGQEQLTALERAYLDASQAAARQAEAEIERQRQRELEAAQQLAAEANARRQAESERAAQAERSAGQLRTRNRIITAVGVLAIAAAVAAVFFGSLATLNAGRAQKSLATAQSASTLSVDEAHTRATAESNALAQKSTAEASNKEAQRQSQISYARELAAQANSLTPRSQDLGLLLGIQAVRTADAIPGADIPEGRNALFAALQNADYARTLRGHEGRIWLAVFSPKSAPGETRVLTASKDGTARLWSLTGEPLATLSGHTDQVLSAFFSPNGQRIVTASADRTARLWDLEGNLLATFSGHTDWVAEASFSPDGQLVVTASSDGTARIWRLDGSLVTVLSGHTQAVTAAGFSPDGKYILTTSFDNSLRLWTAAGEPVAVLSGHTGWPATFNFSPDSRTIVTAGWDGTVRLWDVEGKPLATFTGHTRSVSSAVFSPDGQSVLSASYDNTARLWDLKGNVLATFQGHTGPVTLALFSPDGKQVITSSQDYTARLWSLKGEPLAVLRGHTDWVHTAVFSPDGKWIVTASDDTTARLWDVQTLVRETLTGHTGAVYHAAFSPDESTIATAGAEGNVLLWTSAGELKATLAGRDGPADSVEFTRDGRRLLVAYYKKSAQLVNLDGSLVQKYEGHTDSVAWAAFSPDEKYVATAGWDKTARVYQADGKLVTVLEGHTDILNMVSFSPDGDLLVTASSDMTARLWKRSGELVAVLSGHEAPVRSAVFSPDGKRILTASWDRTARIWDLQGHLLQTLEGLPEWLASAVYSPDGKLIATGSTDGSAALWSADGRFLAALEGHRAAVASVVFSPDGSRLLTTSWDGTVHVWIVYPDEAAMLAAAEERVGRNFTQAECQRYLYVAHCPVSP
jgi:WD40 repeat protein